MNLNFYTLLFKNIGKTTFFVTILLGLLEFCDCSAAKVYLQGCIVLQKIFIFTGSYVSVKRQRLVIPVPKYLYTRPAVFTWPTLDI